MINNKSIKKVQMNLIKDNLIKILKDLYSQCNYIGSCIYIANNINDSLSKRFQTLNDKWYIYALNSFDDLAFNILIKLYNDQHNELSLYNILNYLCKENNFDTLIGSQFNGDFKKIIDDYNLHYSEYRAKLIIRRNNWQIHISNLIFDKEKFDKTITMDTGELFKLYYFAFQTCRKLYEMLTNIKLQLPNHYKYQLQIEKFVNLLDVNGDLI